MTVTGDLGGVIWISDVKWNMETLDCDKNGKRNYTRQNILTGWSIEKVKLIVI